MVVKQGWLWDKRITESKARELLAVPQGIHFLSLASSLLSRNNSPKDVFKNYLKKESFLQNWHRIKRQMRKNSWNDPRIEFWQAIYENLRDKYKKQGKFIPNRPEIKPQHEFCKVVADKIRAARKLKGLSQKELAKRLKISQQVISRIETGRENVSLLTIKKIVESLGAELRLEIS